MDRIKNPDVAAILTMVLALLAEVISRVAADASLLAMLPPWFGPVALAVAASLRLRLGQTSTATGAVSSPTEPEPK